MQLKSQVSPPPVNFLTNFAFWFSTPAARPVRRGAYFILGLDFYLQDSVVHHHCLKRKVKGVSHKAFGHLLLLPFLNLFTRNLCHMTWQSYAIRDNKKDAKTFLSEKLLFLIASITKTALFESLMSAVSASSARHYGQRCGQMTIPRCSSRRIGECLYLKSAWIVA